MSELTPKPVRRNNILLMAICIAIIAIYGYQVFISTYNFDIWNIIATGREILQNGIPYENVFSMIDGLDIVIQQWLLCVIYYTLYDLFGFGGISLFITLVFFATLATLYRIVRTKRQDTFGGEWILLLLILVMLAIEPQFKMVSTPLSILILSIVVLLLEKYRRDGHYLWLGLVVLVIVFHMQVHMSFIVFDLVVIACYLFPSFSDNDYKRLPLLILLIVSAVATLLNPYGIDGSLYIMNSYGAAAYGNVIPELRPQTPLAYGINGICALIATLLSAAAIGKAGIRHIDVPCVLIFIGCTWFGFSNLRNLWMLGLPVVLLGASAMRGWYIPQMSEAVAKIKAALQAKSALRAGASLQTEATLQVENVPQTSATPLKAKTAYSELTIFLTSVICAAGVGVFAMLVALNFTFIDDNSMNDRYTPQGLLSAIERDAESTYGSNYEREDLRIFNPTVLGGYMEWEGYPVYNDSRVEIWNSAISGLDRDLHNEYVDMTLGKWSSWQFDEFVAENEFDYLIAEVNSPLHAYLAQSSEYQNILGTQYYELYKKL